MKIRKIPGRTWVKEKVEWQVPYHEKTIQILYELFGSEHVHFDNALRQEEALIRKWFPYDAATAKVIRDRLVQLTNLMTLKGFSSKTKKAYEGHVRRFCQAHAKVYVHLKASDVETYLLHIF